MPDVYIRLQVASKASSLGIALLMLGVAAHFGDLSVTVRALLVVVFLFLTAPVAAHVIGRAAYLAGAPLARATAPDELAGAYDASSGRLRGAAEMPAARQEGPAALPHVPEARQDAPAEPDDLAAGLDDWPNASRCSARHPLLALRLRRGSFGRPCEHLLTLTGVDRAGPDTQTDVFTAREMANTSCCEDRHLAHFVVVER